VTQKHLDRRERGALHDEVRSERVPQRVPANLSHPGSLANVRHTAIESVVVKYHPISIQENVTVSAPSSEKQIMNSTVERNVSFSESRWNTRASNSKLGNKMGEMIYSPS
jgi:hypothetical protein